MTGITPSQTIGPFFSYCLAAAGAYPRQDIISSDLAVPGLTGERIRIEGRVLDGGGIAVDDALIEIWQADAAGCYAHACATSSRANAVFSGFGRIHTSANGEFVFSTIKPGRPEGPHGLQAPHIAVTIFSRGILTHLFTRIYFEDEPSNADDPVLAAVPADRRPTMVAKLIGRGETKVYRLDIRLQEGNNGEAETVFFSV